MRRIPFLLSLLLLPIGAVAEAPMVGFLDGSEITGKSVTAITDGEVLITGEKEPADLNLLRLIKTDAKAVPNDRKASIFLRWIDGSQVLADTLSIKGERVTTTSEFGEDFTLPIDAIQRIRLKPEVNEDRYKQAFARPQGDLDTLLVELDDEIQKVEGFIVRIDETEIEYEFENERATFAREKVYGIVLAKPELEVPYHQAKVITTKGNVLHANVEALAAGKLSLKTLADTSITLPWSSVSEMALNADRLAFLSDLKPIDYNKMPIVAPDRDWASDKSVAGNPMRLAEKTYRKGIGMVSGMTLVFEPASAYDIFSATIGIDDATGNLGDCTFVVVKDRKEVFRKNMKGSDSPQKVNLNISDAETVTLSVEYAADLDLSDHANWAEACFIKEEK